MNNATDRRKYVRRTCGLCPKFKAGWCCIFAKIVNERTYRCSIGAKLIHAASRDQEKERERLRAYARAHAAERAAYNRRYRKTHRAQLNAYNREWEAKRRKVTI